MTVTSLTLTVLVLLVVVAVVVMVVARTRRSRRRRDELQSTFGAEYDRTVEGVGTRRDAERELAERKHRHDELRLRPLTAASRQRYLAAWDGVQTRFVDGPVLALTEADQLVTQLLAERGYPTDGTRTQEEMLSVGHESVLDSFRAGHAIEAANRQDSADTEQVRQGMLHFRTVFEELVGDDASDAAQPYPGDATDRVGTDADARRSSTERR